MKSEKSKSKRTRGPYRRYLEKDGPQEIPRSTSYYNASARPPISKTESQQGCLRPLPGAFTALCSSLGEGSIIPTVPLIANSCQNEASIEETDLLVHGNDSSSSTPVPLPLDPLEPASEDRSVGIDLPNDVEEHHILENDDSFDDEFCQHFNVSDDDDNMSEEESFRRLAASDTSEPSDVPPITCCSDESSNEDASSPPIDSDSEDEELCVAPQLHLSIQEKIKMMLLLATKKRHRLSYAAAETIMEFSSVISHTDEDTDTAFRPTKFLMKRAIDLYSFGLTEHHVCPKCGLYIGIVTVDSFSCSRCSTNVLTHQNRKNGFIFLYLSLEEQLRTLLEVCLAKEELIDPASREKICSFNYEDLMDGTFYKKILGTGFLTLNFFVDGLQIGTTVKTSAWPVLVSLNEIPSHLRRKYLMIASVWLSKKKPNCNEYLKPFVEECKKLYTVGLQFKKDGQLLTQKFQICVCISDSVARPLLRNCSQFNGKYGCGLCYHPGHRVPFGRGHVRSYSTFQASYPLRTHAETMEYARRVEASSREKIKGVKGFSILAEIPNFDIVNQLDLDSFHCLVNVAKRFAWLWFGERYHNKPFNIKHKLADVDQRLMSITPTSDVSRFPRSLTERSDYRGHEWYYWIVIYSIPCLKNILPSKYLNHWCKLPTALALLMQNSVAKSDVGYAERYLNQFVSEIDSLYGCEHVTFSIHLLTHLGKSVQNFAQPYCHSAYFYEAENAEIKNLVKSSNGAIFQICKGMQLRVALKKLEFELKDRMSPSEIAYLKKMTSTVVKPSVHCTVDNVGFLGVPDVCTLEAESLSALRRAGVVFDATIPHSVYLRCTVNDEVFHSTKYTKAAKQNNSVVSLDDGSIFIINSFIVLSNSNQCFALGHFIMENNRYKLCCPVPPHLKVLKLNHEGILRCVPISNFQSKLLSFSLEISDDESLRLAYINVLSMEMLK